MLEFISANFNIKIKDIFLHNNNWFKFFKFYFLFLRGSIVENVVKLLSCRTPLLGYHLYSCPHCSFRKKIPHSCKSRFCPSCGKTGTDNWINKALKTLPNIRYQHITFTMPSEFWDLFRLNRDLINIIPKLAADTVLSICKKGKKRKHYLPGIFLAIHTFGRRANFNVHIHLSVSFGGFAINKKNKTSNKFIHGSRAFLRDVHKSINKLKSKE